MPIIVYCKDCGKKIRVPDGPPGRRGQCPTCQAHVEIPERSETAPPSPESLKHHGTPAAPASLPDDAPTPREAVAAVAPSPPVQAVQARVLPLSPPPTLPAPSAPDVVVQTAPRTKAGAETAPKPNAPPARETSSPPTPKDPLPAVPSSLAPAQAPAALPTKAPVRPPAPPRGKGLAPGAGKAPAAKIALPSIESAGAAAEQAKDKAKLLHEVAWDTSAPPVAATPAQRLRDWLPWLCLAAAGLVVWLISHLTAENPPTAHTTPEERKRQQFEVPEEDDAYSRFRTTPAAKPNAPVKPKAEEKDP